MRHVLTVLLASLLLLAPLAPAGALELAASPGSAVPALPGARSAAAEPASLAPPAAPETPAVDTDLDPEDGASAIATSDEPEPVPLTLDPNLDPSQATLQARLRLAPDALIWSDGRQPLARAALLLEQMERSDEHGLNPADYRVQELRSGLARLDAATAPALDQMMTEAALTWVRDMGQGRYRPASLARHSSIAPAAIDATSVLAQAIRTESVRSLAEQLAPSHPQYQGLHQALRRHLRPELAAEAEAEAEALPPAGPLDAMAAAPKEPEPVAAGPVIRPGSSDPRVGQIHARLQHQGFIQADWDGEPIYGEALAAAIRDFQASAGLHVDGVIGPRTLRHLNGEGDAPAAGSEEAAEPADDTLDERDILAIRASLERWRWLPRLLGDQHVLVNIPAYRLTGWDKGVERLSMPVVVGKQNRQTPLMFARMSLLTFHPAWYVPQSIIKRDLLPKYGNGLGKRFRVSRQNGWTSVMQPPGPTNPLGRVRFGIENDQAIYLHDTPNKGLFRQSSRAASSGCVRVGDPLLLAKFVLEGQEGWDQERIESVWNDTNRSGKAPIQIPLDRELPVYLAYFTAEVDARGRVRRLNDIYGLDGLLFNRLSN